MGRRTRVGSGDEDQARLRPYASTAWPSSDSTPQLRLTAHTRPSHPVVSPNRARDGRLPLPQYAG